MGRLSREARRAEARALEAEEALRRAQQEHAAGPGADALLDDAARMILSMPGYDIDDESDRKRLRVQLAAMFPRNKEHLADQAIDRAVRLAAGGKP
jgi:hypothetical protein